MVKETAKMKAWDKTKAGKKDDAKDRKKGIKENSKKDIAIDKKAMSKTKK